MDILYWLFFVFVAILTGIYSIGTLRLAFSGARVPQVALVIRVAVNAFLGVGTYLLWTIHP